jgi:Ca2+-binding RTX toxin-like protein
MSSYLSGNTTSLVSQSSDSTVNTLIVGIKWGDTQGNGASISFSFPWTSNQTALWSSDYTSNSEPYATSHYGLNASQMIAAQATLQAWADVANLTFSEVTESGTEVGDIRFAFSSSVADAGAWGWSYYPNSSSALGGDIWINTDLDADNMNFSAGGYGYMALMHEIGHTLGLKHPGNYSGSETGPFLSSAQDNQLYSIMSYNDPSNNIWYDTQTHMYQYVYAQTPMMYDIAAMQYLYGANTTHNNANNVYTYDDSAPFRVCIWDTGGTDTISVAASSRASLINLNEESFSSIQTNRVYSLYDIGSTVDGTYNLSIAKGSVIENAIGGSGDDTLIGNDVNNQLTGNAGNDIIYGHGGNDVLNGGMGDDTMLGGSGNDTYFVNSTGDMLYETTSSVSSVDAGGIDTVISSVSWTLGDYFENLRLNTSAAANGIGNALNNTIFAGAGNNVLNGGAGTDMLSYYYSSAGVSVNLASTSAQATGGSGSDTILNFENLAGTNFNDRLLGNAADNVLYAYNGNDILSGGAGNDTMLGGAGNDTYYVDSTGDILYETTTSISSVDAGGIDMVISGVSWTLGDYFENLRLNSSNAIDGTGNALNNIIFAGNGDNVLDGGLGTDMLSYYYSSAGVSVNLASTSAQTTGGSGSDTISNFENLAGTNYNDTLIGDSGNNVLYGYNGNDILSGGAGNDTMLGGAGNDAYYVDSTSDILYETTTSISSVDAGGIDMVISSVSWTLGDYFENLRLNSSSAIDGTGNALNNIIFAGNGDNVLDGGAGTDMLSYYYSSAGVSLNLASTSAQATGGSGSDTVLNFENLAGTMYNDTLIGNGGNNTLYGYSGNDKLIGGAGNDLLNGGNGNDMLVGSIGKDTLIGGGGNDTFYFNTTPNASTNVDTITDFSSADDVIWLENAIFTSLSATGTLASDYFSATATAQDANDYIFYDQTTGNLYYDADGTGSTAAVQIANLSSHPSINYSDFFIV